jgi:hypothetical protein
MNIPDKVKIGGHTWEVKTIHEDEMQDNAITYFNSHTIKINGTKPKSRQESAFIHELIEVINFHYGINMEHQNIEILEETLYQVIIDNPNIFKPEQ